jgi:hypothetical protein
MKEGWTQGHHRNNAIAHFIAFFGASFTGEPFTTVRVFTTQTRIPVEADDLEKYPVLALNEDQEKAKGEGKTIWLADWSNLQFPALKSLGAKQRDMFSKGEQIHFKADNWNIGTPPREDTQGRVNDKGEPLKMV